MVLSRPFTCLAPVVIGSVMWLHQQPQLPDSGWLAAASFGAMGLIAAAAGLRVLPNVWRPWCVLASIGLCLTVLAAHQARIGLEDRLSTELEGVDLDLEGIVDELPVPTARGGVRFGFQPTRCAASCTLPGRLQLSWHADRPGATAVPQTLIPGQRWALTVRLKRPHAPHLPGGFDRELRWLQEGIGAIGTVRRAQLLAPPAALGAGAIDRARHAIREAMLDAGGEPSRREAGILAALAMGDQASISPALWTMFNRTGVGHLMSISGLHITMLAGLGGAFAGRLWGCRAACRRGWPLKVATQRVRLIAAVCVGIAYAVLAGWGIPAQRTCFMLAVAATLLASGRSASIAGAVGIAAALIVLLDPWAPLTAGFWLSFGAVLAIVWVCAGQVFDGRRWVQAVRAALRTQWAATISLLPLGALFFGSISLVGPLANAVAIPVVSAVVTPIALAGAAVSLVSPLLASWVLWPGVLLTRWLLEGLIWLDTLPGASLALPAPGAAALVLGTLGCILLLAPAGVPRVALGALALLPMASLPVWRPEGAQIRVTALDVGQGMATVIEAGGRVLVYDTGPSMGPDADSGGRVIVPWLRAQGYDRLDALIVSHADDDHSGGARTLLASLPTDWVASSLPSGHRLLEGARRTLPCRRGDAWRWGTVEFRFLHPADPPEPARRSASNALSCVLAVSSAAGTVLLAGDIESRQEARLVERFGASLQADVLLVPHHGSLTSSTPAFLDAVAPRWAIFQVAYRSRFGHPHARVLERYVERGIGLLRSDADGTISVLLSPDGPPRTRRSRSEPMRYWRVPPA